MAVSIGSRLSHAWNAFVSNNRNTVNYVDVGPGNSYRPDRTILSRGNERTIINSIYTRIAVDVSQIQIFESRLDDNGNVKEKIDSGLTNALTVEANIDQTGRNLIQDMVLSMFDEGVIAVVPVDTTIDPEKSDSYDIKTLRVGKILQWYPEHIQVRLYNDRIGQKQDIILQKKYVAILENPFYSIMNEPNSTLKRLVRKLALLDRIDEQSGSGKMDLIIQLPYTIKSDARRAQAEARRKDIEMQLSNSKYGIAYTDGTEKITQLNRSLDNNLQGQIEYLTSTLYNQLGLTQSIFDGTANEQTMLNYYNHTIEPIMSAIADEFKRKFLTKTARTQKRSVSFIRDPFKLVPVNNLAEIADKFTRNEILSSNEIRSIIGFAPSDQPSADVLRNKNLNQNTEELKSEQKESESIEKSDPKSNYELDKLDSSLDEIEKLLKPNDLKNKKIIEDMRRINSTKRQKMTKEER